MGLVWDSALLQAPEPESPSENAMETPKKASKPVISGDLDLDMGILFGRLSHRRPLQRKLWNLQRRPVCLPVV